MRKPRLRRDRDKKMQFRCLHGPWDGSYIWLSPAAVSGISATMVFHVGKFYGRYIYLNGKTVSWRDA